MTGIIVGIVAVIVCLLLIMILDSNRFHTVSYELESETVASDFHFLFLSDLHNKSYGKDNEKLLRAIHEIKPDAILIGGDVLNAHPGASVEEALSFLEKLTAYPLYYANGNHEQRLLLYPEKYGSMGSDYEEGLQKLGISRMINETRVLDRYAVSITGCEVDRQYYKRFHKVPMKKEYLEGLLPEGRQDCFQILLAHNPDYFPAYAAWGADLVLSGHLHGGVIRLPLLGGVISPRLHLFPRYDGGKFTCGNSTMIVSRGLGMHTIPFRFNNPGELVDITIRKRKNNGSIGKTAGI